jgi:hypothetical protein
LTTGDSELTSSGRGVHGGSPLNFELKNYPKNLKKIISTEVRKLTFINNNLLALDFEYAAFNKLVFQEAEEKVVFIKMRHFNDFETCSHILQVQFFPQKIQFKIFFGGFSRDGTS